MVPLTCELTPIPQDGIESLVHQGDCSDRANAWLPLDPTDSTARNTRPTSPHSSRDRVQARARPPGLAPNREQRPHKPQTRPAQWRPSRGFVSSLRLLEDRALPTGSCGATRAEVA